MSKIPEHLGGHNNKTWEDKGALEYLKDNYNITSMIDVGCGPGGQVKTANKLGLDATGIDGDPSVNPMILHDFTIGKPDVDQEFDLAWSVEFLEHVPEEYMDNYFSLFEKSKYVVCTANPNDGKYHYNLHPIDWWINEFEKRGFIYNEKILNGVLKNSTMERKTDKKTRKSYTWLEQSGMAFVNSRYEEDSMV